MCVSIQKATKVIDGIELYYEYMPGHESQPTLVLLHGFLSSSFSFRKLSPLLQKEYNVLSIDFPPFGKSGKSLSYKYTYQNIAHTIIQFLEDRGLKKVILIGHSMGGQLCLQIIKLRPDLADKTILLAGSSYLPASKQSLKRATYIPFFPLFVKRYLEKTGIEKNLNNVVYNKSLIDDEMRNGYLEPFLQKNIFPALGRLVRDREGDLSEAELRQIKNECLLIWGANDRVVSLQLGKRLHKDLSNSQLIVMENTGHLLPEENPVKVYQYIKDFIEKGTDE